jgi:hypothetical protein
MILDYILVMIPEQNLLTVMMCDFKTQITICSRHWFEQEHQASQAALHLPFEHIDGVVAMTMPWSGSGSVTEETGHVACSEHSTSGLFSSRMLRAPKVSFGAKEKEKTYDRPATFSSGSVT